MTLATINLHTNLWHTTLGYSEGPNMMLSESIP